MKIIGYTQQDSSFDFECDYAIDITRGEMIIDPTEWLGNGLDVYYGDWIDENGHEVLSMGPVLCSIEILKECSGDINKIIKHAKIGYIPRTFFKVTK